MDSANQDDRLHRLQLLKDRLENYKIKNESIMKRELEEEAKALEREKVKREQEARLEAERKILIEELQKAKLQKAAALSAINQAPQPQTVLQLQLELQQQLQRQQQPQQQQPLVSFGYPAAITEKEAINWLKHGF